MRPPCAPGNTCTDCGYPIGERMAVATLDGWRHAHGCPRYCSVEGCDRKHLANGLCRVHDHRARRYGDPNYQPPKRLTNDHLEDIEWMAETGENAERAAVRLGTTTEALQTFLARRGRRDLWRQLRAGLVSI